MNNIKEILSKYKSIAMVGVSNDSTKASTIVMKYMQKYGFKVFPVNPKAKGQKILGEEVYEKITDIKDAIDIVNVFRESSVVPQIAEESVKIGAKYLWLQLEVISSEGVSIAAQGGLQCIVDRCLKIEHAKYMI